MFPKYFHLYQEKIKIKSVGWSEILKDQVVAPIDWKLEFQPLGIWWTILKSFFPLNVDIMNRGKKEQKQLNLKQSPRITILIRSMKRYAFDPREYRSLRWAFEFGSCGNIQIHYFISFKISTFKYIPKCWFFVGKLALPWQEQILPTSELGSCDLAHSLTTTFEQDMKISFFFSIHKAM